MSKNHPLSTRPSTRNTTDEQLIADFTKLQDEYDDLTDKFSKMQISAAANRRIHPMGIYNVNDSQQIVNRTTDDSSDDQQINCSNFQLFPTTKQIININILVDHSQTRVCINQRLSEQKHCHMTTSLIFLDRNCKLNRTMEIP